MLRGLSKSGRGFKGLEVVIYSEKKKSFTNFKLLNWWSEKMIPNAFQDLGKKKKTD